MTEKTTTETITVIITKYELPDLKVPRRQGGKETHSGDKGRVGPHLQWEHRLRLA